MPFECSYGLATISRLLKMIGLFCKRALQKRLYSANIVVVAKDAHVVAFGRCTQCAI